MGTKPTKKMTRREELLTEKSSLDKEMLSFKLEEDELQLEADYLATRKLKKSKQQELLTAEAAEDFNSKKIIGLEDEVKDLAAGEKALRDLAKRLFNKTL